WHPRQRRRAGFESTIAALSRRTGVRRPLSSALRRWTPPHVSHCAPRHPGERPHVSEIGVDAKARKRRRRLQGKENRHPCPSAAPPLPTSSAGPWVGDAPARTAASTTARSTSSSALRAAVRFVR